LKYVSGLVFRSDVAAGCYVVSVPDQQGYRPLVLDPVRRVGGSHRPGRRPGTAGAAALPAALILANLIAADPGWATARIRPALILHSKIPVTKLADLSAFS
jgi:hypothetical protein